MTTSGKLREWREKHGVTLEELSDVTGYSVPMLSRVERGERQLSALGQIQLARTLGVKVRDIFIPEQRNGKTRTYREMSE